MVKEEKLIEFKDFKKGRREDRNLYILVKEGKEKTY